MRGIKAAVVVLTTLFSVSIPAADILDLGEGLAVDPADALEIRYAAIPSYDANKKMLSRWSNDKLQYFINVSRLPRGRKDAAQHFDRLIRDLYEIHGEGNVEVFDEGTYNSPNGFAGSYIAYKVKPNGSDKSQQQIAHFLSGSRFSYVAVGLLVNELAATQMHDDTISLFKTASQVPRR